MSGSARCWCGHFEVSHDSMFGCQVRETDAPHCVCKKFRNIDSMFPPNVLDEGALEAPPAPPRRPGYHLKQISRGTLGHVSKIREEFEEFMDAYEQRCIVMQLVELSDLIGAIEAWLELEHPSIKLRDLLRMRGITRRAFENGHRQSR